MTRLSRIRAVFKAIGEFQSRLILTITYIVLTPVGFYLRFSDPLKKRAPLSGTGWKVHRTEAGGKEWFRRMF
jgi:hypothetical protein